MSATLRAMPFVPKKEDSTAEERLRAAAQWQLPIALPARSPTLRVVPLLRENQPRRFVRVPTHAVGVYPEHREYPRAALKLPLKLRGVDSVRENFPITLVTRDVSSTGVYFLCPKPLAVGASIELEIVLISRPWDGEMWSLHPWLTFAGWNPRPCPIGMESLLHLMTYNSTATTEFPSVSSKSPLKGRCSGQIARPRLTQLE